jgi:AraC-like DNA-binding protein
VSTTLRVDPDPIIPLADSLLGTSDASGSNSAEAARIAERFYGDARFRTVTGHRFAFRFASLGDVSVTLRLASTTGLLVGDVVRLDDYVVTWFRDAGASIRSLGITVDPLPGQPVALPSAEPFTLRIPPGRQNLVHVDRGFLEGVATEVHGGASRPLAFRFDDAPSQEAVAEWRRTLARVTPVITDPDATPLVRMESDLALARTLLSVFSWRADRVPPALLSARLSRVRAVAEYLDEHAHLPITPADAAEAVGLHTRSMQSAFQRHLGMSPTEYLRGIRLDRVRRDLVEHTPDTATVGDLARAWGFGNLGRFATSYQTRFGEKPHETLRR